MASSAPSGPAAGAAAPDLLTLLDGLEEAVEGAGRDGLEVRQRVAAGAPRLESIWDKPEAELDVRTLAVRLGVRASHLHCEANPYASALPHLDELFPGRTYTANAFLNICLPEFRLRK